MCTTSFNIQEIYTLPIVKICCYDSHMIHSYLFLKEINGVQDLKFPQRCCWSGKLLVCEAVILGTQFPIF